MTEEQRERRREAVRRWRARNPNVAAENAKSWRMAHPGHGAAYQQSLRETDPARVKAIKQKFRDTHRTELLEDAKRRRQARSSEDNRVRDAAAYQRQKKKRAEWNHRHRPSLRLATARWRSAHPEVVRKHHATRRARKRALFVEEINPAEIWDRDGGTCGICHSPANPDDWHLDHIIPLARGGEHRRDNVQVSHPLCNWRKGDH